MKIENDGRFYQVGEVVLPEGYEGKELHFYISRGKIEVWILPSGTSPDTIQAWLKERRQENMCTA